MMLGDILSLARRSGVSLETWLSAVDPLLLARIHLAAENAQTDIGGFLNIAVADFTEHASEEDWATLTSRLRDADDPGRACVLTMINWRFAASGGAATEIAEAER